MTSLPSHPGVTIESDETVWDGRFPVRLVRFRHRRFDGTTSGLRSWELWQRGRAAAVLPYDPQADAVVMLEQFRLPALAAGLDPVLAEFPAGLCDGAEEAAATAARETREELGLEVDRLERVGAFLLSPGGTDELCTLFVGRARAPQAGPDGIAGAGGLAAEQEDIRVRVRPADEAIAQALAGAYPNAVTSLALLWLAAKREWLRAHWSRA